MGSKFSQLLGNAIGHPGGAMPEEGMMPGTKPEEICPGRYTRIGQHQKGADGRTYVVYSFCCCCVTYQKLSDAVKPTESVGRFLQYGQLRSHFVFEVKEAQKKIKQLAEDDGIDIPYECFEYGTQGAGLSINRT